MSQKTTSLSQHNFFIDPDTLSNTLEFISGRSDDYFHGIKIN